MSLLNINPSQAERGVSSVGKIEVTGENMVDMLMGIMTSMGLTNPSNITSSSSKAVTIVKKGLSYVITLNHYDPPITFTWTGLMPTAKLAEVISKLIEDKKKINYINKVDTSEGSFVQFGVS